MSTRFYGKAGSAAARIVEVFQRGSLPQALAPSFIHRRDNVPCRAWSWSNQLLTALAGHSDARGFRQWPEAGRAVRKGEHAFQILGPVVVKRTERDADTGEESERSADTGEESERDADTGEESERSALVGFKSIPVFGLEQTDMIDAERWQAASAPDRENRAFIDGLPLLSVASAWGLSVETFNGDGARYLGEYSHGQGIALGVKNLSTWAHELVHAADDRTQGGLKGGQHLDQETVAELGGAVLLQALGYEHESDLGGCWRYIDGYCQRERKDPVAVCQKYLERVCKAVALILDTADELSAAPAPAAAQGVAA